MQIPLRAQDEAAGGFQQRKQARVFRARTGERLRDGEVHVRQPTGPTDLARGVAPLGFHAREIGEHIDGRVLRQLASSRVVGACRGEPVG